MKLAPEKVAELRDLAESGVGLRALGRALGVSHETARRECYLRGIATDRFSPPLESRCREPPRVEEPEKLRERWAMLLGPMKERLRAEIEGDVPDGV